MRMSTAFGASWIRSSSRKSSPASASKRKWPNAYCRPGVMKSLSGFVEKNTNFPRGRPWDMRPTLRGRRKTTMTRWTRMAAALLFVAVAASGAEKYLFIWAGDQSRGNPDFLAVVDFDEHSPTYGSVIKTVPLAGGGATGNEPHHVGLSADGRVL